MSIVILLQYNSKQLHGMLIKQKRKKIEFTNDNVGNIITVQLLLESYIRMTDSSWF